MSVSWDDLEDAPEFEDDPPATTVDWDSLEDAEASEALKTSVGEAIARGAAQGATLGFADELAGAYGAQLAQADRWKGLGRITDPRERDAFVRRAREERGDVMDTYRAERDASRAAFSQAEQDQPGAYTGGMFGGALLTSFIPGANVAAGASLAQAARTGAALGGAAGLGASNADLTQGELGEAAFDTALGAGGGAAFGAATQAATKTAFDPRVVRYLKDKFNRGAAKVARFMSAVDEDAALRQITRPAQTAAADADGFAYEIAKRGQEFIDKTGDELGAKSGAARKAIIEKRGTEVPPGVDQLTDMVDEFKVANRPSPKGLSGVSDKEREALELLRQQVDGASAEDLVKLRDQIDREVKHLFGSEGKASPYERQLMQLRKQADSIIDKFDPDLDAANTAYSRYLEDKKLFGLQNDATMEAAIGNLYGGANKTAKRQAAEKLLPQEILESARDVAANKAFDNARGPAGSEFGARRILGGLLALPTAGTSLFATSPTVWKGVLRGMGNIGDKLAVNPQLAAKYGPVLQAAAQRGAQSLAITQYLLSKHDPEFRQLQQGADQGN